MRKSKMTSHVIQRTKERVDLNGKSSNTFVKEAMQFGLAPSDFVGDFYSYLHHIKAKKYKSIGIRVFENNILVYNKNSRTAITIYSVPKKYLPVEQYKVTSKTKRLDDLTKQIKKLFKDKVDIEIQIVVDNKQDYVAGLSINRVFMCFGRGKSRFEAEENALKLYVDKLYTNNKK